MIRTTLLCSLLLLLHYCDAKLTSSCGNIHNISFPFNLQHEATPQCQDNIYTLSCINNRTHFRLGSADYYVKEINYDDSYIRVVDPGIKSDLCSAISIPTMTIDNATATGRSRGGRYGVSYRDLATVVFVNCEKPVKSNRFLDITGLCNKRNYSYVVAGAINSKPTEFGDTCAGEKTVMTASPLTMKGFNYNYSLADVYSELAHGFQVAWWFGECKDCRRRARCFDGGLNVTAGCSMYCFPSTESEFHRRLRRAWPFIFWYSIIGIAALVAARCLCAPCVYGFVIYKFKKRHVSTSGSSGARKEASLSIDLSGR